MRKKRIVITTSPAVWMIAVPALTGVFWQFRPLQEWEFYIKRFVRKSLYPVRDFCRGLIPFFHNYNHIYIYIFISFHTVTVLRARRESPLPEMHWQGIGNPWFDFCWAADPLYFLHQITWIRSEIFLWIFQAEPNVTLPWLSSAVYGNVPCWMVRCHPLLLCFSWWQIKSETADVDSDQKKKGG